MGVRSWELHAAAGACLRLSAGAVAASISWLLAAAVLAAAYRMRPGEPVQLAFGVILGPVAMFGLLLTGLDALGGLTAPEIRRRPPPARDRSHRRSGHPARSPRRPAASSR